MKKKGLVFIGVVLFLFILPYIIIGFKGHMNKDILSNLKGEIYYTKRVDSVLALFKSDANLENETLLYRHKGSGGNGEGVYNDNITDFYYDADNKTITFIAMDNDWSVFSIKEGESKPTWIGEAEKVLKNKTSLDTSGYITNEVNGISVIDRKGSLYIVENGEERRIKKFYGIYDGDFTGYGVIGLSPDGRYLVYSSSEHPTPLGSIINRMITDSDGNIYILDLETRKSCRFINSYDIQWIMD